MLNLKSCIVVLFIPIKFLSCQGEHRSSLTQVQTANQMVEVVELLVAMFSRINALCLATRFDFFEFFPSIFKTNMKSIEKSSTSLFLQLFKNEHYSYECQLEVINTENQYAAVVSTNG